MICWEPGAAHVLRHVAMAAAARSGEEAGGFHHRLLQELWVVIRSFRIRAALRRRVELTDE